MLAQLRARQYPRWFVVALNVTFFAVLIALSAKIRITFPGTPVPFTMQVLTILLAGMALGPVQGASSVALYVATIAAGAPIDAFSLGSAAFVGRTAGFLIGFIPAAFVAGLAWRVPVNDWRKFALMFICGLTALVVVYAFGMAGLTIFYAGSWSQALMAGVIPFVFVDFGKALLAASIVKLGRESWLRWFELPVKSWPL